MFVGFAVTFGLLIVSLRFTAHRAILASSIPGDLCRRFGASWTAAGELVRACKLIAHVEFLLLTRSVVCLQFTVKLHAESFHGYRCDPPSLDVQVTKDQMIDLYTQMVRMIPIYRELGSSLRFLLFNADPNEANGAGSRRPVQGQAHPWFLSFGYRSGELNAGEINAAKLLLIYFPNSRKPFLWVWSLLSLTRTRSSLPIDAILSPCCEAERSTMFSLNCWVSNHVSL